MKIAFLSDDLFYTMGVKACLTLHGVDLTFVNDERFLQRSNYDLYIIAIESHQRRRTVENILAYKFNVIYIFDTPADNNNTIRMGYVTKKATALELIKAIWSFDYREIKRERFSYMDVLFVSMFIYQLKSVQDISKITGINVKILYAVKLRLLKKFHLTTRHPKILMYCSSLPFFRDSRLMYLYPK
ncbi:hypothetical protein [Intestinirhabdus alba]|jgi:hypothetical protein|uniref:Uncharacterized protein n=1 Tax=Intestinirhabdus alba TaxID=2899544 RepID=A0A6L6IKU8_9ENTR|nr:hypothetical protein [Intestinirhabdus alba]MTH46196.1 hypothetical protein [Intestinirhabdus alba]